MAKSGHRKKKRTHVIAAEKNIPRSFVIHTGTVAAPVEQLEKDVRAVMEPYTATSLKVRKNNVIKDFVAVAGPLGVSHFMVFGQTTSGVNMRLARLPRGPTATFRISEYALHSDILAMQKRPKSLSVENRHAALLILNNFVKEKFHHKLLSTLFQNMFPALDIQRLNLNDVKRCVLINYDEENNLYEFRHYRVSVQATGLSRSVKKIIQSRIPNLGKLSDISEFVTSQVGYGAASDSEFEDEDAEVTLPQNMSGVGNTRNHKSSIKLVELGPRMAMSLIKIQQGFCEGEVVHHEYVSKTPEEVAELKEKIAKEKQTRAQRKREQEENVKRKQKEKEARKTKAKGETDGGASDYLDSDSDNSDLETDISKPENGTVYDDEVDDAEYYRREVGEEPAADLFKKREPKVETTSGRDSSSNKGGRENARGTLADASTDRGEKRKSDSREGGDEKRVDTGRSTTYLQGGRGGGPGRGGRGGRGRGRGRGGFVRHARNKI
eukprot:CFRG4854T1